MDNYFYLDNKKGTCKNPHTKKRMIQLWAEYTPNGKGEYQCKFCKKREIIPHKFPDNKELSSDSILNNYVGGIGFKHDTSR